MDLLNELLEGRQRHEHSYRRDHHDQKNNEHYMDAGRTHYEHEKNHGIAMPVTAILGRLMLNKVVLIMLAIGVVVLLVSAFVILSYLLPILPKILSIAGENGLKGLLEQLAPFLNLLWNGSGKP